jgi:hypothetical protein
MGISEAERRVAEAAVELVRAMHRDAERAEHDLIRRWRAAGLRWEDVGDLFGQSTQAVRQRFLRLEERLREDPPAG